MNKIPFGTALLEEETIAAPRSHLEVLAMETRAGDVMRLSLVQLNTRMTGVTDSTSPRVPRDIAYN